MNIVGEEDGDANAKPRKDEEKLRDDCFEFAKMEEVEDVEVRVGDCVVFVDPVDGTREFIEERYQNCQCLIGIAHKGRAVVGVVGIPFPKGKITKDCDVEALAVVYGMCYEKEDEGGTVVRVLETCNETLLGNAAAAATTIALAETTKTKTTKTPTTNQQQQQKKAARIVRNDDAEFAVHPHYQRQ